VSRISVVIPTLDRPGPLSRCLQALAPSFPADAETIVVSDGGAVDLGPWLAPFVEPLRLRYIVAPHGGPASARNHGLAAARGDIVAFIDDDCRPRPGWLLALTADVSLSPPRATGGTTCNGLVSNAYAEVAQLVLDLVARYERETYGRESFFPSNNVAFPVGPLRQLGGFDVSFWTAEDRELCRRWRQAGFGFARVSKAVVDHDARLNFIGFLRQFFAYGQGSAQFHLSGDKSSFGESVAFHLRLPRFVGPQLVRNGPRRGAGLLGLFVLWEMANLAGFLTAIPRRSATSMTTMQARQGENSL
jgi:glycosyltransferase involved in cell wall biosynthesis